MDIPTKEEKIALYKSLFAGRTDVFAQLCNQLMENGRVGFQSTPIAIKQHMRCLPTLFLRTTCAATSPSECTHFSPTIPLGLWLQILTVKGGKQRCAQFFLSAVNTSYRPMSSVPDRGTGRMCGGFLSRHIRR